MLGALALTASLALLLSGCSRHTALTVRADLIPFLDSASTQTTVPYTGGTITIDLPPNSSQPTAGTLVDLNGVGVPADAIRTIDGLALDFAVAVMPDSDIDAGTATLYIAPASETDIFQSGYEVAQVSIPALPATRSTTVTGAFQLDAQHHADAFTRVQSGSFRLGVALHASAASGGQAQLDLTRLEVAVSLPPGWGLP
jgi:hypothetical protein